MRYLKPHIPNIKIGDNEYNILFSLDVIDELQDKTNLSIHKIITMLTEEKTKIIATQVLIKYLTGQMIDDNDPMIDYYSSMLLTTYIEQSKPKNPKPKITASDEYEFMDIESWFYVGKVLLGYPENEVWEMTLGKLATLRNEYLAANGFTKEEKEQSLLFI